MSEKQAKPKSSELPRQALKQDESSKNDLPPHILERISVSYGRADLPVLKDLFGDDAPRAKDNNKFFRIAKTDIGTCIESVEFVGMACPNCKCKVTTNPETEMDFLEESERSLVRLCIDEMEGRE